MPNDAQKQSTPQRPKKLDFENRLMGQGPSQAVDEDPKVVFVRELFTRLWVHDVLPAGQNPRRAPFPIDVQDRVVLPIESETEDRLENMKLPRDVWLLVFDLIESPRDLGRLCAVCKTLRRLVLTADRPWRRWSEEIYPELFQKSVPSLEVQRQLVAWKWRIFVGDCQIPPDLDSWMLAPPLATVRVLVASFESGCGKSNLIARFVRNRFVGDSNRLSLALEQHSASKTVALTDGTGGERTVQVELEECSSALVELYAQQTGCDCLVVVSARIDCEFVAQLAALRERLLALRGCAPLVVARSKSDLRLPQEEASATRAWLRKVTTSLADTRNVSLLLYHSASCLIRFYRPRFPISAPARAWATRPVRRRFWWRRASPRLSQ